MKKTQIISTLLLSTVLLAAPISTLAARPEAKTYGDVKFVVDDDAEGGNPGEPRDGSKLSITKPVVPGSTTGEADGSHGSGSVRLEWVPNFHFGERKITTANEAYNATWTGEVTIDKDGAENETQAHYPQFAQVTDESGKAVSQWRVELSQSTFKGIDPATSAEVTLPNTFINLFNTQMYNSNSETGDLAARKEETKKVFRLNDMNNSGVGTALSASPIVLGQTTQSLATPPADAKSTSGSKTSIVFATDDEFNGKVVGLGTDNQSVKLVTPSSDVKVAGVTYSADLNWNLIIAN